MSLSGGHDNRCELFSGFTCRCWLRARGRHPSIVEADAWLSRQHPFTRRKAGPVVEDLNRLMHEADLEQEELRAQLRP